MLLFEDFEQANLPEGWSQATLSTDGGWLLGHHENLSSEYWSIAAHGNFIATNDDACDCDKSQDYLIMPSIELSGQQALALQFESYFDGDELFGGQEKARVAYSLDGLNWQTAKEMAGTNDGNWDSQIVDLGFLTEETEVQLAFQYDDDNNWLFGWAIDDVTLYEPEGLDLAVASIETASNINTGELITVIGKVSNRGLEEVNSFDLSWNIGGSTYTTAISGVAIPALSDFSFSHPDLLQVSSAGAFELQVSVSKVNGNSQDHNPDNDTRGLSVQALENAQLEVGGLLRDYIYYHPHSAAPDCPIIYVCHGYTGSAQNIMEYSGFNDLADEHGFAVCYLQGSNDSGGNSFFNVGYAFQDNETVDDVQFLRALDQDLHSRYSLSTRDIFCTGFSNGADFSYLLACEASDLVKAVAPVAGMILQDIMDNCDPEFEVSIFEIHGTDDDVTYYGGDPNNIDNWGAYPGMSETMAFWTDLFDLSEISSESLPNLDTQDGSTIVADRYSNEQSCTEVWLYTVDGAGHDWPGNAGNMDISASREIWNFFAQLCEEPVSSQNLNPEGEAELIKIFDIMGREASEAQGELRFYLYSNGHIERQVRIY